MPGEVRLEFNLSSSFSEKSIPRKLLLGTPSNGNLRVHIDDFLNTT